MRPTASNWSGLNFQIQSARPPSSLRHLGGGIRNLVDDNLANRRLALGTVGVIALIALHIDFGGAVHLGDLVRTRGDRMLRVLLRPHLLAIRLRHDVESHRHVIERRGKHPLQLYANMAIVHLGRVIEIGVVARSRDLLVGQDRVDRVDDIVGRQLVAVVKGDIWAQREFKRRLVNPLVRFGEQRLELEGLRIAIDERIPDLMPEHEAGAKLVVVRRDVWHGIAPGDAQRVGRFLRRSRHRTGSNCCHKHHTAQSLAHRHHLLVASATIGATAASAKRGWPSAWRRAGSSPRDAVPDRYERSTS